ncbi:MAG: lysine--tRNA ligase, partial [Candidatus Bathyarchaeia archaeon]
EQISQEKYLEALPYFPVCEGCGRIYTTRAYRWTPREWKVLYRCEAAGIRGEQVPGCGHEGEVDIREGRGKLSWKAEFAVRWEALNIDFEAYGKDIADSVRVNDEIMREVLRREPPYHVRYEMFLDKGGRKISKSAGNVLTPQVWLRYGSSSSLLLLMFKRIVGTRELSVEDIPKYMDELDDLEDIYFGKKKVEDERERAKLKGLYEYCHLLKPPQNPSVHVPYATLLELAGVAPTGREKEFIIRKLTQYGIPCEKDPEEISRRIAYALNWVRDFRVETRMESPLTGAEKNALETLIKGLKDCDSEEAIQNLAFKAAKEAGVPSKRFFQIVYMRLLNKPSGPKLGPYIASLGIEKAVERLQASM